MELEPFGLHTARYSRAVTILSEMAVAGPKTLFPAYYSLWEPLFKPSDIWVPSK